MASSSPLLLAGGVGGWAATTELSGAVIAPGAIVVDSNVKKVQHLTGGIVGELLVRDGQRVNAGEVVLRLDETITRANLAIVTKGLDETDRAPGPAARPNATGPSKSPFRRLCWHARTSPTSPLPSKVKASCSSCGAAPGSARSRSSGSASDSLTRRSAGTRPLQEAKAEEIELIQRELEGVRALWNKNLVQINRLISLEREAARLKGERAQSVAAIAQSRGKIGEIELQIIQIDQDLSSEVARELREVEGKIGEFIERKVAAEDQLKRVEIRAPQDGVVHQLAVHTVGGVVSPSDPIMLIVPEADALSVEAKVSPQDIDQLRLGQAAGLRFSAFNQRTTPEISGTISRVSADVSTDQRSGQSFYTVRIALPAEETARLGNVKLVPGMPVEAFMKTYDRTVLSYFIKPLEDQVMRAFRER